MLVFVLLPFAAGLAFLNQDFPLGGAGANEDPKCSDCHTGLLKNRTLHAPASESCDNCHQVDIKEHAENGVMGLNLSDKVPALCFICHDGLQMDMDSLPNVHQAVKSEKSCMVCHSPHSSEGESLLISDQKKLCLSCHNRDVGTTGAKMVNIKRLLANARVIHSPVESDGCVVCHKPHSSSENYLLNEAFPIGNYAAGLKRNFALCWECHDSDLLEAARTTSSTNFRNGDRNLHFVHMNGKDSKSCVMCHNVHASNNEHLIEDRVGFGEWGLPIKFVPGEKGGSCFPGCHAQKSYTR